MILPVMQAVIGGEMVLICTQKGILQVVRTSRYTYHCPFFFYKWIALQWGLYDAQSGTFNDNEMVQTENWEPALEMDFSDKPKD